MKKRLSKLFPKILFIVYFLTVVALAYSVILSGFFHLFDTDELINSQKVYLNVNGYKPFISYFSIYSPILHWILQPVFAISGFTFVGLTAARIFMILLFGLRLFLIFYIAWKIFGKWVAYGFVLMFLLDPFTVFSAMQIRPDNLALFFLTLALVLLSKGLFNSVKKLEFSGGFFLSLAFLSSIKVMPSVFVVLAVFFLYCLKKKSKQILVLIAGFIIPCLIFFAYFLIQNSFMEMIQQLYIDSVAVINLNRSLAPLGFFLHPDNGNLYGYYGKPPAWFYEWILPILAFIGLYQTLVNVLGKKVLEKKDLFKIIFILSLTFQWLSLFFTESVYLQYYLPVSWLFAFFAAVALYHFYEVLRSRKFKNVLVVFSLVCLLFFVVSSIKGNMTRADGAGFWMTRDFLTNQASGIPDGAIVFPNILFHPLANQFVLGYPLERIPQYIIDRYPPLPDTLEKKKVPYLYFSFNYNIHLRPEWMPYIASHYKQVSTDSPLWVRTD